MLKRKISYVNLPMHTFATLLKAVIPTKLTINHCPLELEKTRNVNNISRASSFCNKFTKILKILIYAEYSNQSFQ